MTVRLAMMYVLEIMALKTKGVIRVEDDQIFRLEMSVNEWSG